MKENYSEIKGGVLILHPLKPKIVKVDPNLGRKVGAETRKEKEIFFDRLSKVPL